MLDADDKAIVLDIAKKSVEAAVAGREYKPGNPGRPALETQCGCFVTIKTDGQLRGCIGCFTSDKPLYQTVAEYAGYSVMEDPRFAGRRLRADELPKVALDVSVLSPLEQYAEPEKIILGVHGIYVKSGGRSGCFLPQVATETGWSVEEFWGHCCRDKAGLDWNAWQKPGTNCMVFTAEVFEG